MKTVKIKDEGSFTNSLVFAKDLEMPHNEVLKKIRRLVLEFPTAKDWFTETEFTNKRNRKYPIFLMNRDAFMFLIMNTGAKEQNMQKVWDIQWGIITALEQDETIV
ncbi:MAG: Rha family transcriptional regulator [Cetobacterium sp.]